MLTLVVNGKRVSYDILDEAREAAAVSGCGVEFWRETLTDCVQDEGAWNDLLNDLGQSGAEDEAERLNLMFPKDAPRHWLLVALMLDGDDPWDAFLDEWKAQGDERIMAVVNSPAFAPWLKQVQSMKYDLLVRAFGADATKWPNDLLQKALKSEGTVAEIAEWKGVVEKRKDVVEKRKEPKLGGVQLWKNGPFWAECNVGASNPEDSGYYFWWGDTMGYRRTGDDQWVAVDGSRTDSLFDVEYCPTYSKNDSDLRSAGYIDSTGNLAAEHDAARAHLGFPWRMPTKDEFDKLYKNCMVERSERNGKTGFLFRGKGAYASKNIFLPFAGVVEDTTCWMTGSRGKYWSSTPCSWFPYEAWSLHIESFTYIWELNQDDFRCGHSAYHKGQPVRPVRGFAQ